MDAVPSSDLTSGNRPPPMSLAPPPVEDPSHSPAILAKTLSAFLENYGIDLSESTLKFSLCFRLAAQHEDPDLLYHLLQVTPLVSHRFHYVTCSAKTGRVRKRFKLNKDFLYGEFEKRTGAHLDHPGMKEMVEAMRSLNKINSGKLLKIVHKYYVLPEEGHQSSSQASRSSRQSHSASVRGCTVCSPHDSLLHSTKPQGICCSVSATDEFSEPAECVRTVVDSRDLQSSYAMLARLADEVAATLKNSDPSLATDSDSIQQLASGGSLQLSEFSQNDNKPVTTANSWTPGSDGPKKVILDSTSQTRPRQPTLSCDEVTCCYQDQVSQFSTPPARKFTARQDLPVQDQTPSHVTQKKFKETLRYRKITNFINKAIDTVFSDFLVWHAVIIAACSGDVKAVKTMLSFQSRFEACLMSTIIPKVAKEGFAEISKTLHKLRLFIHSKMLDILIKLVAESGNDNMVFELLSSDHFGSTQTPTCAPKERGSHTTWGQLLPPGSNDRLVGVETKANISGTSQSHLSNQKMINTYKSISFDDAYGWKHNGPYMRNSGDETFSESIPKWTKFHMWEYGLWEFQLVVPVLLMRIESDSKSVTVSGFATTGLLSQDSLHGYQQRVTHSKSKCPKSDPTISDYTNTGLYSSGSEVSGRYSPIMTEISSLAKSQSGAFRTLLKNIYPSFRISESRPSTFGLAISRSSKQIHSAIKQKLPKLGILSTILPSKNFHRYRNLKPLAHQAAHLHVQLKTAANEITGTGYAGKSFLEMSVAIDNVRCRVGNAAWDGKRKHYRMGHFPTLIEISLSPISCSSEDVSVSLTRSSNNPAFEVTLNDSLSGGGGLNIGMAPTADLTVGASSTATSAVTSTPWRFEQFEVGTIGGGFSWTLHSLDGRPFDRLHPQNGISSTYYPTATFLRSPFTKLSPPANPLIDSPFNVRDGGVVFAGSDYPYAILWRFREDMRGATVTWEIKGRMHSTFVSGRDFWETRVENFREVFQQELVVNSTSSRHPSDS